MVKNRSPQDRLINVKNVFLERIIPSIQQAYEKAKIIEGTFILIHCCILSLSGYFKGTEKTNKKTYVAFVKEFFPKEYEAENLWKYIRNYLIHAFTFAPLSETYTYVLSYSHPELHLKQETKEWKEKEKKVTFMYINLENFIKDLRQAAIYYFKKIEEEKYLLDNLCRRYDYAKPLAHISDEEIVFSKEQLIEYKNKLFSGLDISNKKLVDKKISELLDFCNKNYTRFEDDAKEEIDKVFDRLSDMMKKNIDIMPNGILKRKYLRMHAISAGNHALVQQLIDLLEQPIKTKEPILKAIRSFFIPKLQQLLDLLFDITQVTFSGPVGVVQLNLFYICFHELLVAFHLTQKFFVTEASPHIRRIFECLDLIELFSKEPMWVDLWMSDNKRKILKELSPSKVRLKLGKEKFDPKSAFFSELGVHGTFNAIQARTGKSLKLSEKGNLQLLILLGGQAQEHQLIHANLSIIEALISVILKVTRNFENVLDKNEIIEILNSAIPEYTAIMNNFFIKWAGKENIDVSEFKQSFEDKMDTISKTLGRLGKEIRS